MKSIGLMTENFKVYYDLVKLLRKRKLPFMSIPPDGDIPANVGVVITTSKEAGDISFFEIVCAEGNLDNAIRKALLILDGKDEYTRIIIGIDPGKAPGVAVVGDGKVLETYLAPDPESVVSFVDEIKSAYPHKELIARIGHQDELNRNRIINGLARLDISVEITDETNTTKRVYQADIESAISIARIQGYTAKQFYDLSPSRGALRNIQRLSRIKSKGKITISSDLARGVARGEMSLEEAIAAQERKGGAEKRSSG